MDRKMIEQVVINLLKNAVHSLEDESGSKICITAERNNDRAVHPHLDEERNNVTNVAITNVHGRQKKAASQGRAPCDQKQDRQENDGGSRRYAEVKHHSEQNDGSDSEIDATGPSPRH